MPVEPGISYPRYKPVPNIQPDSKNQEGMYNETNLGFSQKDVQGRYEAVLGPLSLFAPYPHEDVQTPEPMLLNRPVTPIDEEIRAPPKNFSKLAQYVRRRIAVRNDVQHISSDDQQYLAGTIMGEVNAIWEDIRLQVDDPFLTPVENRELNRRIIVHIVTVCEELFKHYLEKARVLNARGIFSGPANMSRLKAQLALDANKFLNFLTIRRYIVSDMREGRQTKDDKTDDGFEYPKKAALPEQPAPLLSYRGLLNASRPKSKSKKYKFRTAEEDLQEMEDNLPVLDTGKLLGIISDLPDRREELEEEAELVNEEVNHKRKLRDTERFELSSREKIMLKRCGSLPQIHYGETLAEELGLDEDQRDIMSQMEYAGPYEEVEQEDDDIDENEKAQLDSMAYAAQDLAKLTMRYDEKHPEEKPDEDLPPLLQALSSTSKHDNRKEHLKRQLDELERKEQEYQKQQNIQLEEPLQPQPATVAAKMPNKMIVRTSDIRVSERVCMSSITINQYNPVYNDLVDEIDPQTVKALDKNLFLGDEIKEVYKEIMKTVPTDHLDIERGDIVEPVADYADLSKCLASATLGKKKVDRVINESLQTRHEPPWQEKGAKEWVRTPGSPPKDKKGVALLDPMTPDVAKIMDISNKIKTHDPNLPSMAMDFASRSYASWLNWWKHTITSDDYMKYLSTQESDYINTIFHFYDSEEEDDEEEMRSPSQQTAYTQRIERAREKEEQIEEMRKQKKEYEPGMWNVNSVLLGGLGKDPADEEEEDVESQHEGGLLPTRPSDTRGSQRSGTMLSLKSHNLLDRPASHIIIKNLVPRDFSRTDIAPSRLTLLTQHTDTKSTITKKSEKMLSPQDRLERVWASLQMPDAQKLDMAIKYSSHDHFENLERSIEEWERATRLVLQREELIARLEKFEREASDPNRFFDKGYRGSSVARLDEARHRSSLYRKIEVITKDVKRIVTSIEEEFGDKITFQGRPYLEKMQWDRTEMLYWLQEERKQQMLEHEARIKQLPLRMAQLEPITPTIS
ncbi:unnamed protein product [Owenia fusiformis]|uniref:Uncharacterized protein n=1 Tax=Owenia fusiformis TaxID=6347 RepID=A0A8J1TXF2_OWEFU|nr:unnamed protein product [Owenia fusiformis]